MTGVLAGERRARAGKRHDERARPGNEPRGRSIGRRLARPAPWMLTLLLALLYLLFAPPSPDLAAASYRSDLFARVGFSLWDNSWYGGHHLPAYSVLAPALGALLGPRLLAAASATAAAVIFERLVAGAFPPRAVRTASLWFAFGVGVALLSSRVPFDLGLALGLGALASARAYPPAALALCVLCSLASPVAGAFLALALVAWALAGGARHRARALALLCATLAPLLALVLAFPEGGTQPFVASAFYPPLAGVLALAVLVDREHRVLRAGVVLYALMLIAAYVVPSALGANAGRLGALLAGPLAALVALDERDPPMAHARGRVWVLAALAPLLVYWQVRAPVADTVAVAGNPSVKASYYAPVLAELRRLHVGYGATPARVEVVPGSSHWEARFLASEVMIARGWERQLDIKRNGVFYGSPALTPASYHAWLLARAVSLIALPDAPLDYSGKAEARLLRGPLPSYLREVWRSRHWRLFAVLGARALITPPARVLALSQDSATLSLPRAGDYTLLVHFTPYWAIDGAGGCVSRAPGPDTESWTRVSARRAGRLRLVIRFSLGRVLDHGPRCG